MSLENNILQPGSGSIPGQNQVGFLFCDHISHDNSNQAITSEITFAKPVKVQQIRIPKGTSQILPKFKPNINTSQTQPESIKSLEIFAKDLENPSSRFETLVSATNLKELYNQDIFYTMPRDIMTTHIIVRGIFRQITLLIYGDVVEEAEAEREDIPLDDLKEDNENLAKSKRQEDEDRMVEPQHISDIYSYFKTVNTLVHTPSISINTDNIRPKLLFEDESGKVRSNNDEIQIIEAYTKELNKVITGSVVVEQTSKYLQHIDQLFIHIDELLKQNDAHIRLPADFNDNVLIYRGIPLSVVRICLKAFSQKYDDLTEVYHGLQLAKSFLNSFDHAYDFIQGDGLEKIYQAILEKEGYVSPYIKVLALEVINMCLSYDFACERFVNLDITKLESFADQSQPVTATKEKEKDKERDKEKEKEKDKERTKEREKDRDESKERKHGKSKSKQHSGSKSRSRSKSSKKSKKRKHKDRKSKKDRSRSPTRSPSKSKKKSSKHKKKRESESPSESRSPSRTRKESKPKEVPTIDLKINVNEFEYIFLLYEQQTGYQKILNQLNKSEVTKVNYSIRQVLHKAGLYCYLSDLSKNVEKDLLPEIDRLKRLEGEEQGRSFKEYNSRITHLNEIIDSISTSLRNFLPIFVSQLLCNGRMVTGELKFEECVAKPFLKEKLQGIGIMTHLVTILKHDHYVVSHDMSVLFKRMNFLPSLALCMASDYVINSPHFEDLFMNIRKIFVTLLGAKGGVCFLAKNPQDIKLILNILDYLQRDLKELEAQFPEEVKAFHEDNMAGLFDYCEDFEMNILNSIKDTLKGKHFSEKKVRLGILARQLSSTLKYIIHAINALDIICVKHMAEDYNEILLLNLTSIAHIVNKNRVSNQALKSLMVNDFVMQLLISIMASKNAEEVANKSAEITLAAEIIYQIFRRDTGELPLLWGEALNKVVPPIAKILKDEKNQSYFKDEPELKASITLLENYMEPIYTYSILNEKDDGVMLLLIEFNKKCRYQGPPKLGIQQKHSSAQKHDHDGLPPMLSESISLRDDIKYFGNSSTPNSPIIYMESALNILNIMASYYHNILIHYLEKDIFAGVSMITNSLCLIIEKILTPDTLSSYTHKILNLRNSYVNTYLCTLTKALYLIYQRMEYRLGSEENSYENMDLLQALLNLHAACFNYCHGNAGSIKQTNITKQYLVLTSELIVSILTIWSEFSAFTEVFIYELCYRYFTTVKNRSATLFLLSTILRSLHQNDKTLFSAAIRTLVSPYKSRKYERKLDNKERDRDASMPKERKPLPIFKVHHHDEFFEEHLRQETPLFELFVESFVEAKSAVFEVSLERFLEVIFLRTEFKYQKELMSIFERKWKSFYENRQESLGEDTFKMRSLGMMVQILAKTSKSDEFKTYLIDKKVTSDLIRILQIIEDEFYSHTMFKRLTSARRILLLQIKESIYDIFINLCNHDIGVVKPDTTSQEHGHLLENIPSISEIQDLLKTIVHELTTVDKLTERINKMREEGAQQANGEMSDESQEIDDEGLKASLRGLIKAFKIIENLGRNVVGQYILLNTEYSKIIRNPSPIIYFNDFYASLIHLASLLSFTKEEEVYNVLVLRIMQNFLHCVYLLCYNPLTNQILNSEKRKTSLKALLLKNKSIKVPNMSGQASTVVESLESLSAILIEKKRALYEHKLDYSDQLEHYREITSSIDVMLFETICLANYFNLNPDHKKDNEKIYIDMDHPKEIEQKFKDAEEKEAAKELSQTLLDIRAATNSNHKLSTQAMILIDYSLDDLMAKPNQPLLAWKKGRFHNVAREQWGLFENRISGFKYSHLNDVEVEHWDYDGCVTFNKRKLEVARKKELINKDGPYKRSEHVRNHLFLLFETNSLFNNQPKENIFTNKITYTLECPEQATARLDEKPLTASKEKQFERKPKHQISSENYYTLAQLTSQQDSYIKQQQQQQQPNLVTRQLSNQKSNSRPSSMHVDQFTSKQHSDKSISDAPQTVTTPTSAQQKGITGGPSITTPSRSMSLEPQMSPINREDSSKELIRTSSSTSMQGPSSFIPQEFPTAQTGGAPMGQPLIGTQSSPQGDMLPYQRPGAINTQQSIPGSIKVGGGPINMGPGSGQNMPGPGQFSQGAPLNQVGYMPNIQGGMPGGMGPMNPGMNVPMGQQQMMGMPMNPNMGNNMYPNRMQQQGGRMHPGGPGGPGGFNTSPGSNRQQQSHGGDMRDLRDIRGMIRSSMDSANNPNQRRENHDNDMMMPEGQHHPFPHGGMMHQQMGGPHMGPMGPVDQQQQQQNFPHGGPVQGQGPQPGLVQGPQGGVPTRVDEMNSEERTLMQEIMTLRQRNDPRCTQRIKEILKHNPRILAFIRNQNRGQPGPGGPSGPGGQNSRA